MHSDLRASLRSLVRRPTSSLVIVAILALGIAALAAGWSAVETVLMAPLPFADPDRLVRVHLHPLVNPELEWESSMPALVALRAEAATLEAIEGWGTTAGRMVVRVDQDLERTGGHLVTAGWFDALGVQPKLGRSFETRDDLPGAAPVAILSELLWEARFASDPGVLGRILEVDGTPREIVGIMPDHADLPAGARLWVPLGSAVPPALLEAPQIGFINLVARLAEGATPEAAQAEMDAILRRVIHPQVAANSATSTRVASLAEELRAPLRIPSLVLLTVAFLVLLTGMANVGGLLAVCALQRRSELAVRLGLGAGWRHLVRLATIETGVLAVAGGVGGAVLAPPILEALVTEFPQTLFRAAAIRVDTSAVLLAAAASVGLALVTGSVFGWWARRIDAAEALRAGGRGLSGSGRRPLLRLLAGAQIALAVVVALAAGLLLRGRHSLASTDPGYGGREALTFQVPMPPEIEAEPETKRRIQKALLDDLQALPGIDAAGGVLTRPLHTSVGLDAQVTVEGRGGDAPEDLLVNLVPASSGWFETSGMRLIAGRGFRDADDADAPGVVVLTRSLASRLWHGASPLGQRLKWGGPESQQPWLEVVGLVDDTRWRSIEKATPTAFIPFEQSPTWGIDHLAVRASGDPWAHLEAIRTVVARHVPGSVPLDTATLAQMVDRALAGRTFIAVLVTALAGTSLVLAALGLYGLLSFLVTLRGHETGIRMALGAAPLGILAELLRECGRLAGVGVAGGLAVGGLAALSLEAILTPHLAGLSALDLTTFAAVAVLMIGVAFVAGLLPARRAAACHPATVLRDD